MEEPKLAIIALEETEHWAQGFVEEYGRIWRIYLTDLNRVTYMCSYHDRDLYCWHLFGISERYIEDDEDQMRVYLGSGYHGGFESDLFDDKLVKSSVIYILEEGENKDYVQYHDLSTAEGHSKMMEEIVQAYRENEPPINIVDGNVVYGFKEMEV